MERFIPKDKLSKKAKRALNAQYRQVWEICPVSRKRPNKKAYNRKTPRRYEDENPQMRGVLTDSKRCIPNSFALWDLFQSI